MLVLDLRLETLLLLPCLTRATPNGLDRRFPRTPALDASIRAGGRSTFICTKCPGPTQIDLVSTTSGFVRPEAVCVLARLWKLLTALSSASKQYFVDPRRAAGY